MRPKVLQGKMKKYISIYISCLTFSSKVLFSSVTVLQVERLPVVQFSVSTVRSCWVS